MSLFNIFDIASSGMSAQSVRLNITASNLANADSVGSSKDEIYRARQPVFATVMKEAQNGLSFGSVEVKGVVEMQTDGREEYNPNHPMANDKGYIYHSNVDPIAEKKTTTAPSNKKPQIKRTRARYNTSTSTPKTTST